MKTVFVLLFAFVAISGGIYADSERSPNPPYPHVQALGKFKEVLKLSDAQLQDIEKVNKSFKEKHKVNKDRLDPLVSRLREVEQSTPVDYVAAEQVLKEISEIHAFARLDKMKHHQALMTLLTEDQKAEFKKQMAAKKEKRHDPKAPYQDGHNGPH